MVTGSATANVLTFTKGDGSTFNLTVNTGSAVTVNTGSLLVTASISDATTTYTKGDGSTFALTVNNVQNASTASIATSASFATSSSFAQTASFALNVTPINTGSFYLSSSVTNATITFNQGDGTTEAVTVNNVSNASTASIATSASFATTASFAVSASFAPSTPAFPFSGSAVITGSLVIENPTDTTVFSLTQGGTSAYAISHGGGFDTLLTIPINATHAFTGGGNNIYKFETPLVVSSSLTVTGSVNASSFTGSLFGTASFAISSSFATSASVASNAGLIAGTGTNSLRSAPFLNTTPATASGVSAIAIGNEAEALADFSIAIGFNTEVFDASRFEAVAIGKDARTAQYSVAIGSQTDAVGSTSTALGYGANANGDNSVAIGNLPDALSNSSIAIGNNAQANGTDTVSIGTSTNVSSSFGIAIGPSAVTIDQKTVSIGSGSRAEKIGSIVIGSNARSFADNSVMIGTNTQNYDSSRTDSVAIGNNASTAQRTIAIGLNATGLCDSSVIIGRDATANADFSVAIGQNANANDSGTSTKRQVAIGVDARTKHEGEINIGNRFFFNSGSLGKIELRASSRISGSLEVTGSINVSSGSFSGSVINNLTTPTASNAVEHVVALSTADYSAIVSPDPNTFYIINDATGSLVLGNTVVSGSLTVTGALTANLTASVVSASYATFAQTAPFNSITNFYSLIDNRSVVTQTIDANAGGLYNLHISASGLHKVDASTIGTGVSASLNSIYYIDSFSTGSQAVLFLTANSGSGNAFNFRTIISSSAGTYLIPNQTIGNATNNVSKQTSFVNSIIGQGAVANPTIFTVMSDGTRVFGNSSLPNGTNNYLASGNQGTPLT